MTRIPDLPVEIFFDHIFTYLPTSSILSFGCTDHFFNRVVNDEAFWHRRIQEDFSGLDIVAQRIGWKALYKRLSNPMVFVWGEAAYGRLGRLNADLPQTNLPGEGYPTPLHLDIPGVRIVSLVAGGWSFHAVDSHGDIYVWGTLDASNSIYRHYSGGFAKQAKTAEQPMRLDLPVKFHSISCGRMHATALDASSQVWTFTSWGRPFRFGSTLLDKSAPETTPIQVESGWSFSSILTKSGDVLVYWPFSGRIPQMILLRTAKLKTSSEVLQTTAQAIPSKKDPDVIPCYWWISHGVDPVQLPPIPFEGLPELKKTGISPEQLCTETKLVKIAGYDNNLIGLTNKGHVLRYGSLQDEDSYQKGRWEYLPLFSDIEQIKNLPAYTPNRRNQNQPLTPPETMLITHISASFKTFFVYSTGPSSVVLQGSSLRQQTRTGPLANRYPPTIIPELQNRSVISIVLGDYHYGALTATGQLLTWGAFSRGALGQGMRGWPQTVPVPTEVMFEEGKQTGGRRTRYCIGAAACGWHTGALVVDLDDEEDPREDHRTLNWKAY